MCMFPSPDNRMLRMRKSFEMDKSILVDDYMYFITPRAPIRQSKAERKSEEQSGRRSPKWSGTRSSGRIDD
jgi:hypothetical protein